MKLTLNFDSDSFLKEMKNIEISHNQPYPLVFKHQMDIDHYAGQVQLVKLSETLIEVSKIEFINQSVADAYFKGDFQLDPAFKILKTNNEGLILKCELVHVSLSLKKL